MTTDDERIDPDGVVWWVAEQTNIDSETVRTVLDLEFEFIVGAGIAVSPDGASWDFHYYDPAEVEPSTVADLERMARDAERLAGVPFDIASRVLDGELEFLEMRGFA